MNGHKAHHVARRLLVLHSRPESLGSCADHRHGDAVNQHHRVAPVKLIGLSGRKGQRHEGSRRVRFLYLLPRSGMAADGVTAAVIPAHPKLFIKLHFRQPFAGCTGRIDRQQPIQFRQPTSGRLVIISAACVALETGCHSQSHEAPQEILDRSFGPVFRRRPNT